MKKQLFFFALVSFIAAQAGKPATVKSVAGKTRSSVLKAPQTPAEQLAAFVEMEKRHKDDWFNSMKENANEKADLLMKQHDEMADLKMKHIEEAKSIASQADVEMAMSRHLTQAIALHKQQTGDWEMHAKDMYAKKKALCDRHKKELAAFEAKI